MKSIKLVTLLLVLSSVSLSTSQVRASTDFNGLFDARSAGMGGTGVAYLDSAGAIPTNPGLLDQVGTLTVSLDTFVIFAQPEAPYTIYHLDGDGNYYQNYETIRSEAQPAVLPFLGAAYRLSERFVVGAAIYPIIGNGTSAEYRPSPDELPDLYAVNEASMGLIEAGIPVSVRLLDNLSVGAMWRISYMVQSVSTPVPTGAPPAGTLIDRNANTAVNADIDVTGWNFAGFQVGVFYKVIPALSLGFTYRNKVEVEGTGTTTTRLGDMELVYDMQSGYTNPHTFRAGAALTVLDERLLIAADFKYLMYAESWKERRDVITMNGEEMVTITPTNWKDSIAVLLGAEFQVAEVVWLRGGYAMVTSATDADYAMQLFAPPGISHLATGGLGVRAWDDLTLDFAFGYVVLQSFVDEATPHNSGVGVYASHGGEFSLSGTYRM